MDFLIESFSDRDRIISVVILLGFGYFLIVKAKTHKITTQLGDVVASKSIQAKKINVILVGLGILMIIIAIALLFKVDKRLGFKDVEQDIEEEKIREELTSKGGYGDLPIVRIDRNCFARGSHEHENYSLFAGSYNFEESAARMVSTLDRYNIRDVEYFQKQCDTVHLVGGQYFVFLGRRCTTLKSIQQYETKYETMFREEDFVDLKIVKFVE